MARPTLRVIDGEACPAKRAASLAARGYSAGASAIEAALDSFNAALAATGS